MMRRSQTYAVAGNCCLVPVLILLAIIVAAVIGSSFVWHAASRRAFPWELRHYHSDAYRDGYQEGNRLGADYAHRGDPEPTGRDLDALALREAERLHIKRNRGQWLEGFRNGFARGFANSEAWNKQASWLPLPAPRDLALKSA